MSSGDLHNLFDLYLTLLSLLAILIVPASLYCTIRAWGFVRKYRGYRLPTVFAIVNTIAFPAAFFIGILAWNRLAGNPSPNWTPPVSAAVFILLDIIPLITTGYMVWVDRRSRNERRSPPSE